MVPESPDESAKKSSNDKEENNDDDAEQNKKALEEIKRMQLSNKLDTTGDRGILFRSLAIIIHYGGSMEYMFQFSEYLHWMSSSEFRSGQIDSNSLLMAIFEKHKFIQLESINHVCFFILFFKH